MSTLPGLTEADLDRAQRWRVSPLVTVEGGERIDTDLMLSTGAIAGPYRRSHPFVLTLRVRAERLLRRLLTRKSAP